MIFLELVTQIKKAALDAIENSKPVNVVFGVVVSEEPIEIKVDQKLILGYENLVFLSDNPVLQVDQNVVLIRAQGGQKFVVLEAYEGSSNAEHNHDDEYLGITDKACDSDKLDGMDSTDFASANHNHGGDYSDIEHNHDGNYSDIGHNHDNKYLGKTAKACDSDKLDGLDSSQFLRSDVEDDAEQAIFLKKDNNYWGTVQNIKPNYSSKTWSDVGNIGTNSTLYPKVYGESDLPGIANSNTFTYEDAVMMAESYGGRLPTLEEIMSGCGKGSGQGYDSCFLWTQSFAGAHHVWVCFGNYSSIQNKKIVDITDPLEVYRMRIFFDVDKGNKAVYTESDGSIHVDDIYINGSDFDTEVSNNTDVSANTAYRGVGHIPLSQKGSANGVAELDGTGKVSTSQLPSYVDDVVEYATLGDFPTTGETGKIYITLDTNKTYRWSGTAYVEISESLALGETSDSAYRGDRGKTAYDHSQIASGNPHNVKATQISNFDTEVSNNTNVVTNTAKRTYPTADENKLNGIEAGAEVNNVSDANATDLTDGGDSNLHYHSSDRNRANHTGTQAISTINALQSALDGKVNRTGDTGMTNDFSTNRDIVSGRGSGGVALTINDGYGNANVTWNHQDGKPEQNGNAGRIQVNTDATTNATMTFGLRSNVTGGVAKDVIDVLKITETKATILNNEIWHEGNDDTLVKTTGNQTIGGVKTFSAIPKSSGTPVANNDLITKEYAEEHFDTGGSETVIYNVPLHSTANRGDCLRIRSDGTWEVNQEGTRVYDGNGNAYKIGVVGGFSGLDTKYTYYFQSDGSVGITVTNYPAGNAISTTEIDFTVRTGETPKAYTENMVKFYAISGASGKVRLKVEMPVNADGVRIRRKTSAWTASDRYWNGTAVADITNDDDYDGANEWLEDTGLVNGTVYYYKAFPYRSSVYNETFGVNIATGVAGKLLAEWDMDNSVGNIIADTADGNYNATATSVTFTAGKVGLCAYGTGGGMATIASITPQNKVFAFWVNADGVNKGIIGNTDNNALSIRMVGNVLTVGNTDGSHGSTIAGATTTLSTGWHFCTVTIDSSTGITIHVDTVQVATGTMYVFKSTTAFTRLFYSVAFSNPTIYLNGKVDQIRVFSSLSPEEQTALYNGGAGC